MDSKEITLESVVFEGQYLARLQFDWNEHQAVAGLVLEVVEFSTNIRTRDPLNRLGKIFLGKKRRAVDEHRVCRFRKNLFGL